MQKSSVVVKQETITPERAKEFLENNRSNRAIRKRHVEHLAKAILAQEWDAYNGETLIVDSTGCLLDGQHRCQAVILANTPIDTLVTYGVDPAKRATIDTGFKRTLGDFFDMHGYANGRSIASAALWLHAYEENALCATQGGGSNSFRSTKAWPFWRRMNGC